MIVIGKTSPSQITVTKLHYEHERAIQSNEKQKRMLSLFFFTFQSPFKNPKGTVFEINVLLSLRNKSQNVLGNVLSI